MAEWLRASALLPWFDPQHHMVALSLPRNCGPRGPRPLLASEDIPRMCYADFRAGKTPKLITK